MSKVENKELLKIRHYFLNKLKKNKMKKTLYDPVFWEGNEESHTLIEQDEARVWWSDNLNRPEVEEWVA